VKVFVVVLCVIDWSVLSRCCAVQRPSWKVVRDAGSWLTTSLMRQPLLVSLNKPTLAQQSFPAYCRWCIHWMLLTQLLWRTGVIIIIVQELSLRGSVKVRPIKQAEIILLCHKVMCLFCT